MKFFYDTEFIEDGHIIDLISIGMVAEDGRSFYAISTEFKARKAGEWVQKNVLVHLPDRYVNFSDPSVSPRAKEESQAWMNRLAIRDGLLEFIGDNSKPELWAYYADYDHVALCQLFGRMIDLPEGWPKFTYDLRQWLNHRGRRDIKQPDDAPHNALEDARWVRETYFQISRESVLTKPPEPKQW